MHGWHGWGFAPRRCPDGVPTEKPSENPPGHPGGTPVEQPPGKPNPDQPVPVNSLQQILDLTKGSVIG